jgi:hypothetical protein
MALVEDAPVQGWKKYASKFEKKGFLFFWFGIGS